MGATPGPGCVWRRGRSGGVATTHGGEASTFASGRTDRGAGVFAFKAGILAAMVTPLILYSFHALFAQYSFWRPCLLLIALWGLMSDSHVFATGYLYLRPRNFHGIRHRRTLLYLVPAAIVAVNLWAVMMLPPSQLMWVMIVYVHYALFHFARQNIGVLSFVTLTATRRPLHRREKLILSGVAICGMLGALKLYTPGLLLNPEYFAFDLRAIAGVIEPLYIAGLIGYAVVFAVAVGHFLAHRHSYDAYSATIFWLCVAWYVPIYAALGHPLLSIASFTTAHGLQYLVLLGFHAYRRSRLRAVRRWDRDAFPGTLIGWYALMPCFALAAAAGTGALLWHYPELPFAGFGQLIKTMAGASGIAKAGAGLVAGITLAHFWVDQFIWRSRTPERRGWLLENYPFLAPST
jgi:hypothetical protein